MSVEVSYLTLTEVAERTGVRLSAVSNWRARHSDFPKPQVVSGQEVFEVGEVLDLAVSGFDRMTKRTCSAHR